MTYSLRLDNIIRRARRLSQETEEVRADLLRTLEENKNLKLRIDNQANEIEELNNKIKIIRLAHSFEGGGETAALKKKINEYIREIDQSIALLND